MADQTTPSTPSAPTPAAAPADPSDPVLYAPDTAVPPGPRADVPKFKQPFAEAHQIDQLVPTMTAAELRAAQEAEYGMFVAAQDIYHGTALAFRLGQAVPVSSVSDDGPVFPYQVALARTAKGEPTAAAKAIGVIAASDTTRP